MTDMTRRQLQDQILSNLGVLAAGQVASTEDLQKIEEILNPALATLNTRDIIYIQDNEAFPEEVFLPLAAWIANAAKASFGRAGDQDLLMDAKQAEVDLKTIARPGGSRPTLQVDRALIF